MKQGFAQVPNNILWNPTLSMKAKGLWAYIKSKPPHWDFSAERIAKETKESRKSILSGLQELDGSGFLLRQRLPSGRVVHRVYPEIYKLPESYTPPVSMDDCVNSIREATDMDKVLAIASAKEFAQNCVDAQIKRSEYALKSWINHHKPQSQNGTDK